MRTRHYALAALLFLAFLCYFNTTLFYNLFLPNARPNPPGSPDIPKVLISYFTNASKMIWLWTDLLFGRGLQGSSIWVKYLISPPFFVPFLFSIQEWLRRKYNIEGRLYYATWPYLIFASVWTFVGASINGIAQAEDWYWIRIVVPHWPGSFDVCTHAITGSIFAVWLLPLAIATWFRIPRIANALQVICFNHYLRHGIFQWPALRVATWLINNKGTLCAMFDEFSVGSIILAIAQIFEWVEFMNPDKFGNVIGNSFSDMAATTFIGVIAICYVYDKLVPLHIGTYGEKDFKEEQA